MEIIETVLPLFAQRVFMPAWPVFAAAPDIGEHIGIAAFNPEQPQRPASIGFRREVLGCLRRAEAAIGMD